MNKFVGIGRVISDPSFRQVGGVDVCDFRLSVRTRGKDDAGYPKSIVVKCTIWRKLAEMAKSFGLHKSQMVGVCGMLDTEMYTSKDGKERTSLVLDVDDIDFIRTSEMPAKTVPGDADDTAFVGSAPQVVTDPDCPF